MEETISNIINVEPQTFDDVLARLGAGRWTLFMYSTYLLWSQQLPYFSMGSAFYNPQVDHWCRVPELDNASWTQEQKLNYSIPWELKRGQLQRSPCNMYVRNYTGVASEPWSPDLELSKEEIDGLRTESCKRWHYDNSTFTSTVAMEWDLVCSKGGLSPFFQSFYFFGTAFGEPLLGVIADKYGRKCVLIGVALLFVVTATSSALVPLYSLVLLGRFVAGMCHGIVGPSYIHAMEACPPKYRTTFGLLCTMPFAFTGMAFGVLAYFIRDWRTLQLVCTLPVLFLLIQIPFLNESPRWLVQQGRLEEAAKILQKAAKWQGVSFPPPKELITMLGNLTEQNEASSRDATHIGLREQFLNWLKGVMVLFSSPTLRKISFAMFGCWFTVSLTFWGIMLSGTTFSTNPFLYVILSSLVEVPGYSAITPAVARLGRRFVLAFNFAVCSVAIFATLIIPKSSTWMVFILALIGKLFITGSYGLVYLFTAELYPTCVRSRGLNISSFMARIGSTVSPFIIEVLARTYWWSPAFTFGVCAAIGCGCSLSLPESKDKPLVDTVAEIELLYGKKRNKYCEMAPEERRTSPRDKEDDSAIAVAAGL